MRKLLIISLILFGLSPLVKGQMLNLNYQMSVPLGKMNDYAGKMSFRGMDLEYHHFLNEKFSIGGMIGWNTFYKDKGKLTGDFLFKGSKDIHTITGYQYRYINTVHHGDGTLLADRSEHHVQTLSGTRIRYQLDRTKNRSGTIHCHKRKMAICFRT